MTFAVRNSHLWSVRGIRVASCVGFELLPAAINIYLMKPARSSAIFRFRKNYYVAAYRYIVSTLGEYTNRFAMGVQSKSVPPLLSN